MQVPRFAVGTVQPDVEPQVMAWALLDLLERSGPHVQSFLSESRFVPHNGALTITGESPRHLDTWLMSQKLCTSLFNNGVRSCDLAVVEGCFESARRSNGVGSSLEQLCRWLGLPAIAIVDASRYDRCALALPQIPLAGILLDNVRDQRERYGLEMDLEMRCKAPVLGYLPRLSELRTILSQLPPGKPPCDELCEALGAELAESLSVERLLSIAASSKGCSDDSLNLTRLGALNVAVAYDEAFNSYFSDTLDLIEAQGATVHVFSPLRSDSLPADTDLVYFGCGHAERFASTLAANCCLKQALKSHAAKGGRIYAECTGLAYLCEQMVLADGRSFPMAGVLPAVAVQQTSPDGPTPIEMKLQQTCWLGRSGETLRGYLNPAWQVEPLSPLVPLASAPHERELLGHHRVIGSRVHLNFAAQPGFLNQFFQPVPAAISVFSSKSATE